MPDRRRRPIRHGTVAGYQRCRHLDTSGACEPCKQAWREYFRTRYRKKNTRAGDPARARALENLAARHPSEFLHLYEKAARELPSELSTSEGLAS